MNRRTATTGAALGFSLVEVMIALIIISVGMLGIAKLEAVVLSNTSTSRVRALVALQAASLADSMHADRDFWDNQSADWTSPLGVTVTLASGSSTLSATNSGNLSTALGTPPDCTAQCTPVNMAGYDVSNWATALSAVLPNSTSTITCTTAVGVTTCTVQVQWNEGTVAANQQEAAPAAFQAQTYTLVVEP